MKFVLWFVLCVLYTVCPAVAAEHHMTPTELWSDAIGALPNGGTLFIDADITTYEQKVRVKNRYYTEASPLVIDGQGHTTTQPVDVSDSAWVVIKNLTIYGGIGLESSQKDYSKVLQHVTFKDCTVLYGRLFAGGYTYHDITIQDCTFQEIIYKGTETHGIYFSGGHWEGSVGLPHPNNINIIGNTIRYCGGRHGIQVNGCFDSVRVKGNTIYCAAFTGFQGIGIVGCEVSDNTIFLGNRGCINIYDYWDGHYWDPSGPAATDIWRACHHPNDLWHVHHNTFLVGPTEWCWWQDGSKVEHRPAILINNELVGTTFDWPDLGIYGYEIDYEPTYHWIHDNLIVSPWANMIEYHDMYSPWVTHVQDNMFYTYAENAVPIVCFAADALPPGAPLGYSVSYIEEYFPDVYSGNVIDVDPKFKVWPVLPHATEVAPFNHMYPPDATVTWAKWFDGMHNNSTGADLVPAKFNLYSGPAAKLHKGRRDKFAWAKVTMRGPKVSAGPSVGLILAPKTPNVQILSGDDLGKIIRAEAAKAKESTEEK